ncbi:DUF4838 domain-containing protein [Taibaiella lutea]|uniref:DUF4838 domain-containing protein n=1 Tax=Taibaiella lutea TaxID=2608001 RepID=A0A5M6CE91_9BACT|nr:DUF4838 domain-containing protein [Taibaiella lutea]KAA5532182.1 DUF4838 domain-containing protein [Taibaiella lutea]
MSKVLFFLTTLFLPVVLMTASCKGQSLKPVAGGASVYAIVIADGANKNDNESALLLQKFIKQSTGVLLNIVTENKYKGNTAFYVGQTSKTTALNEFSKIENDGYLIATKEKNIFISGRRGHATEYGVYHFIETYMNCRKYDGWPAIVPFLKEVVLPADLSFVSNPSFVYRQSYYPMSNDAEYLNWHGLHKFEDLWGIWGHSFFKLIPPQQYLSTHPEYFALVNGRRTPTQLCLSNPEVLKIVISKLRQKMTDNPDAEYWSVSPNDGGGNCSCDDCKKVDAQNGGPSGSLIRFVNQVAASFPDKKITTLAYGYTSHAPTHIKPAGNVVILLSTIDAYREKPLSEIPSASGFRNDLTAWKDISTAIFIWDYCTQFTNYMAPFPVQNNFQPDYNFFKDQHVTGVFEQGSGDTYSDMAELNSYIQAKLLWNTKADIKAITDDFCKGYYGTGASSVQQYLNVRQQNLIASGKHLDIYGNPINDRKSFLSPEQLTAYNALIAKAAASNTNPKISDNIERLQLPLLYTTLQQSRHYGTEEHGFLQQNNTNVYKVNPEIMNKVHEFVAKAKKVGVVELSEGGYSPEKYQEEWNVIFARTWPVNLFYDAKVKLATPFAEDYPAKGNHTLTDGMTGFNDFSYNWLCFYGTDMDAVLDAGKTVDFKTISINFLDDPRHWIFLPVSVSIAFSDDGINFKTASEQKTPVEQEHDDLFIRNYNFKVPGKSRYIKVIARNNTGLPSWRNYSNKKPMIACDEIMVMP